MISKGLKLEGHTEITSERRLSSSATTGMARQCQFDNGTCVRVSNIEQNRSRNVARRFECVERRTSGLNEVTIVFFCFPFFFFSAKLIDVIPAAIVIWNEIDVLVRAHISIEKKLRISIVSARPITFILILICNLIPSFCAQQINAPNTAGDGQRSIGSIVFGYGVGRFVCSIVHWRYTE